MEVLNGHVYGLPTGRNLLLGGQMTVQICAVGGSHRRFS